MTPPWLYRLDRNRFSLLIILLLLLSLVICCAFDEAVHLLILLAAGALAYLFWTLRGNEAISSQKKLFKGVFNSFPGAMVLTSRERTILLCNPGTTRTFGYSAEEITGGTTRIFYAEENDFLRVAELYKLAESDLEPLPITVTFRHKNGHRFPGEVTGVVICNSAGKVLSFMVMLRDVSARVEAERALTESERRFRELVSLLPQPVIEMDRSGMITFANHNAFQYFLYKHEDFATGIQAIDTVAACDRERAISDYQGVLAGDHLAPVEYRMRREEGEEFPAMVYASPVLQSGEVVGVRSLIVDITELRQADAALRDSEQTLRAVFNSVYDAIILHDQKGRILDLNDQTLTVFALTGAEARNLSFSQDLSSDPQKSETLSKYWHKALAGEAQFFEWDCRRPSDSSTFYAEVFLRKITLKGGDVLLANIRDISERKESETRLRDNHRRLNYLAYHDTLTSLPNLV